MIKCVCLGVTVGQRVFVSLYMCVCVCVWGLGLRVKFVWEVC